MAFATIIGALVAVQFLVGTVTCNGDTFKVPDAKIAALSPSGIEVTIPNVKGMESVTLHGNLNTDPGADRLGGSINQELKKNEAGDSWVYTNKDLKMKVSDKFFYWISVTYNQKVIEKHDNVFEVKQLVQKN